MLTLMIGLAWSADCVAPTTSGELQGVFRTADEAFVAMDSPRFRAALDETSRDLECLSEPLTLVDAASIHRVHALDSFLAENHSGAVMSFRAVLDLQPGYELPLSIAPTTHPLRADFSLAQQMASGGEAPLLHPSEGYLQIDGRRAESAPSARPYVFQRFDAAGRVKTSAYIPTGGQPPSYPVVTLAVVAPTAPVAAPTKKRGGAAIALGIAGLVVGAGVSGVATASYEGIKDETTQDALDTYNHTLTPMWYGGGALFAVGGGALIYGLQANHGGVK